MQAELLLTACLFAYSCTPSKTITARGTAMLPGIKDGDTLAVEILVDKSRKLARTDIADSRLWGPVAADLIEGRIVKN